MTRNVVGPLVDLYFEQHAGERVELGDLIKFVTDQNDGSLARASSIQNYVASQIKFVVLQRGRAWRYDPPARVPETYIDAGTTGDGEQVVKRDSDGRLFVLAEVARVGD